MTHVILYISKFLEDIHIKVIMKILALYLNNIKLFMFWLGTKGHAKSLLSLYSMSESQKKWIKSVRI